MSGEVLVGPWGVVGAAELESRVAALVAAWRAGGVSAGDRVAFRGDFTPDAVAALLAAEAAGAVAVPLGGATAEEAADRIGRVDPEWLLEPDGRMVRRASGARPPLVERLVAERRSGLVLESSGTSGRPKVMLHDLGRLRAAGAARGPRKFRATGLMGFDHIGGLDLLFRVLGAGATLVVPAGRSPAEVCSAVAEHRVEVLSATPSFLRLLLASGETARHDLTSLRVVTFGAERMPEELLERFRRELPGVEPAQRFGTSETGAPRVKGRGPGSLEFRFDDPAVEHRVEGGELWLRTPTTIVGYLDAPEEAVARLGADGWFRTGDLVEQSEGGWLRVVGRVQEVINVGGEKVMPGEVEEVVLRMPVVADARAYGVPNLLTGQAVALEVELREPWEPARARREVRAFLLARLAPAKVPVRVDVVAAVATTARGKKRR